MHSVALPFAMPTPAAPPDPLGTAPRPAVLALRETGNKLEAYWRVRASRRPPYLHLSR